MDQRLLFSALTVDLCIPLWPGILLVLSTIADMNAVSALWLFLAEISVLLAATSLSMTMLGIFRRGKIGLRTSQLLIVLGVFALFGTLVSAGYVSGAGHWAAMDCGSPNPWKCNLSQATVYVNFYFIPSLLVSILVVSSGMGNLALSERLSLNRDLPRVRPM